MDEFYTIKKIRDKAVEESKQKYLEDSKKKLSDNASTKLKTSFIGAISEFEQNFGFLWGYDKCELTEDQIAIINILEENGFDSNYFREIWEETRNNILNKGNAQIRAYKDELKQYTIHWDRYQIKLPVIGAQKEEKND